MTTVSFYLITVYTMTFGTSVLKLTDSEALLATMAIAVSNFIWLPLSGALSDRIGRKPILVAFTVLALLTAYPALAWLVLRSNRVVGRDRLRDACGALVVTLGMISYFVPSMPPLS